MNKMKHQDGYAPSPEETAKLNEISAWLDSHNYKGIILIHKGSTGVSWVREDSADSIRHTFINSISHIARESQNTVLDLVKGMILAINQIKES